MTGLTSGIKWKTKIVHAWSFWILSFSIKNSVWLGDPIINNQISKYIFGLQNVQFRKKNHYDDWVIFYVIQLCELGRDSLLSSFRFHVVNLYFHKGFFSCHFFWLFNSSSPKKCKTWYLNVWGVHSTSLNSTSFY